MKYKNLILLIMLVLGVSCMNKAEDKKNIDKNSNIVETIPNKPNIDSNVYYDIDLFKLEGIGKIKNPTDFPYIKIETISEAEKKIIYKYSATDSSENLYKKEKRYWLQIDEYRNDSGYSRIYEYIQPDKITRLVYYGSHQKTGFHLDDIIIIEKNKSTMYSYWDKKGPTIEPKLETVSLVQKNCNAIVTTTQSNKNGILKIISNSYDKRIDKTIKTDTTCYLIKDHTQFWFETFGWDKKVACN